MEEIRNHLEGQKILPYLISTSGCHSSDEFLLNYPLNEITHIVVADNNSGLWHCVRFPDGKYSSFRSIFEVRSNPCPESPIIGLTTAGINGELHLCIVKENWSRWHIIRRGNGEWTEFGRIDTEAGDREEQKFATVLMTSNAHAGTLHLVINKSNCGNWHSLRHPDPDGHLEKFRFIDHAGAGNPGEGVTIGLTCAATADGDLHVCMTKSDGRLWHCVRKANDGHWEPFRDVYEYKQNNRRGQGLIIAMASSSIINELHLCIAQADGSLSHIIRHQDGSWEPWGDVYRATNNNLGSGPIIGLASAVTIKGELELIVSKADGSISYCRRMAYPNSDWYSFSSICDGPLKSTIGFIPRWPWISVIPLGDPSKQPPWAKNNNALPHNFKTSLHTGLQQSRHIPSNYIESNFQGIIGAKLSSVIITLTLYAVYKSKQLSESEHLHVFNQADKQMQDAYPGRNQGAIIYNESTSPLYIKLGEGSTIPVEIPPNSFKIFSEGVDGICAPHINSSAIFKIIDTCRSIKITNTKLEVVCRDESFGAFTSKNEYAERYIPDVIKSINLPDMIDQFVQNIRGGWKTKDDFTEAQRKDWNPLFDKCPPPPPEAPSRENSTPREDGTRPGGSIERRPETPRGETRIGDLRPSSFTSGRRRRFSTVREDPSLRELATTPHVNLFTQSISAPNQKLGSGINRRGISLMRVIFRGK